MPRLETLNVPCSYSIGASFPDLALPINSFDSTGDLAERLSVGILDYRHHQARLELRRRCPMLIRPYRTMPPFSHPAFDLGMSASAHEPRP